MKRTRSGTINAATGANELCDVAQHREHIDDGSIDHAATAAGPRFQ